MGKGRCRGARPPQLGPGRTGRKVGLACHAQRGCLASTQRLLFLRRRERGQAGGKPATPSWRQSVKKPSIRPSIGTRIANARCGGTTLPSEDTVLKEHSYNDSGSVLGRQIFLFILRKEVKITGIQIARLNRIHQLSNKPVTSPQSGAVVSVTSYGKRLRTVHLTLESIAAGSVRPSRLILWVDTEEAFSNPSKELKRLIERGLELRLSENFGPHTKYYPYLLETESFACPLVTADDDQLYPNWWLEGLLRSYQQDSASVSCYRAHRVEMANDAMAPYESWKPCRSIMPSCLHFATGVSGVLYPPFFLKHLKGAGREFLNLCPKQDDA